jgi:hypothetical protein
MVDIEKLAKDMENAMIEAAESEKEAISEVDKSITERIASLRREREELKKGKDEYLLLDLIRQGASDQYIKALKEEINLTKEAREEEERRSKRRQKDAELDAKLYEFTYRERVARRGQIEADMFRMVNQQGFTWEQADKGGEKAREALFKEETREKTEKARELWLEQNPIEKLKEEIQKIEKLGNFFGDLDTDEAIEKMKSEFLAREQQVEERRPAEAAMEGSVQEFQLLREMSGQAAQEEERRHREQILEDKLANKNLAEIKGAITDDLPSAIASSLEPYFAESVA